MKKRLALFSLMMALICLGACVRDFKLPKVDIPASAGTPSQADARTSDAWDIRIIGAEKTIFGMQEALSLPVSELELSGEVYRGVALTTLLEDVGAEDVDRLAVKGKANQRIRFAGNDINSRILLCWSKNYKPLPSLTLVARIWGETYILPDVQSIRIVRKDPDTTQPNG